jgi:hypothetical protein
MKKIIFSATLLITSFSYGQNVFPSNGNVGIGTNTPATKLDVTGEGHFKVPDDQSGIGGLTIETNNGTTLKLGGNSAYSWIQSHNSKPLYINELGNNTILNLGGGNVGIGTTTPDVKFTVNGNAKIKENLFITGASGGYTTGDNPILYFGVNSDFAKISVPFADKMIFSSYHGYTFNTSNNGAAPVPALTISVIGNLGIGTILPDEKLTVKGKIHSQEVKVDMLGSLVPDYVFAKNYNLKTLKEVETFINKNNHLPEMSSANEVEKNGLLLAEMNMKLLQKIEELTLYAIDQEKKTEKLTLDLKEQSKIILGQNKRIEKLEKQ